MSSITKRTWKYAKHLFWTKDEWQQAAEQCAESNESFAQISPQEQVKQMISWLIENYPVDEKELEKAKQKV